MWIHIDHQTRYRFARPVTMAPHTVRLRPRADAHHHLARFDLHVMPPSARRGDTLDLEGNATTQLWFDQPTDRLELAATSLVETRTVDPFHFLLSPHADRLPFDYGPESRAAATYLSPTPPHADVAAFADAVADAQSRAPLPTLAALAAEIHRTTRQVERATGQPLPAEETLARGQAACRDLTVLLVACLRHVGIAARFVSGYALQGDGPEPGADLHAWAEAYVPGGGWRGFDPGTGLAVTDRHVAVAAAADPAQAAPVTGSYHGDAPSQLTTRVAVRSAEAPQGPGA